MTRRCLLCEQLLEDEEDDICWGCQDAIEEVEPGEGEAVDTFMKRMEGKRRK